MEFAVITARERGRLVPQWQLGTRHVAIGEFHIREVLDAHLRRHTKKATLIDRNTGLPCTDLPPLWDAVLGYASVDHWIVTGFEQVDSDGGSRLDFAQTWILTPADRLSGIQAVEYSRRRISGI